ncbi:MAG: YdcF family protein [Hyphomicrobiaceae bacterium]
MLFYLSAIFGLVARPSALLMLALIIGLIFTFWRPKANWPRRLALTAAIMVLACGILPIGNALMLPLENRFSEPKPADLTGSVRGLILLGGFEDGWVTAGRPGLALNEAAERLTEGVRWAKKFPNAKVVFTGGVAEFIASHNGAAGPVGQYLTDMNIASDRILLEPSARNTYENAMKTRDLVQPARGQKWLLITSAYHMPRSIGIFRRAGFDVIAVPVDFRTRGQGDLTRTFKSIPAGLARTDVAVREWLGLLGYWLMGRTADMLPGP